MLVIPAKETAKTQRSSFLRKRLQKPNVRHSCERDCKNPTFVIPAKETAKTQRSSFLTPLAPLIRGELASTSPPDKGDLGGWVFRL